MWLSVGGGGENGGGSRDSVSIYVKPIVTNVFVSQLHHTSEVRLKVSD